MWNKHNLARASRRAFGSSATKGSSQSCVMEAMEDRVLLSASPQFITPIQGVPYRDWTITNYTDVDAKAGEAADYKGGGFSYDGHTGIDFAIEDLTKMDQGVQVYAAAPGTVKAVHDGEFDRSIQRNPSATANYVIIDHGNGWETWYWHLRKGSITVKPGQQVNAGDVLGLVGSSGDSNGPHLHFEVRYNGQPIETYENPSQFWVSPLPYAGTQLGSLGMGVSTTDPTTALNQKVRPASVTAISQQQAGRVYAWVWAHGDKSGDTVSIDWLRPDGSLYDTWSAQQTELQPLGWWEAWVNLPNQPQTGTWQAVFRINGVEYARSAFTVVPNSVPSATTPAGGSVPVGSSAPASGSVPANGSIAGVVFNDGDANGRRRSVEKGLPRVRVFLDKNRNGRLDKGERSTLTNSRGAFRFVGLTAGIYTVREVTPAGWRQTTPRKGAYRVLLGSGQNLKTAVFGDKLIHRQPK